MTEGKRPGGLTALAVINFVFGGFGVLGLLAMLFLMALLGVAADTAAESGDEATKSAVAAWEQMGLGLFYVMMLLSAVSTFLLIASGVGYLKQKRFLGRTLGNSYAILSIASSLLSVMVITTEAGGGFNILTLVGLAYPVLTLALLNTTFKEDFIR